MSMMSRLPKLPTPDPGKPRSRWETIVTLTPVVLTVIATVLAGLSSNEMTQAQYYRALAAQNQSKAGDQWAFFQAKRIRNTIIETTLAFDADPLHPIAGDQLHAAFSSLAGHLRRATTEAEQAQQALTSSSGSLKESAEAVRTSIDKILQVARSGAEQLHGGLERLDRVLASASSQAALAYLGGDRLPTTIDRSWENPELRTLVQALAEHRSEAELTPQLLQLDRARIDEAIRTDEENVERFEQAARQIADVLGELDTLVKQGLRHGAAFERAVAALEVVLPAGEEKGALRNACQALVQAGHAVRPALDELKDYRSAREDLTGRRNEREARYNQKLAGLYEVQVHKASVTSERHRRRSRNFFYGMLVAQAGVTIASFALAARHKSELWGLAGVAGLAAVAFSVYVYLCL